MFAKWNLLGNIAFFLQVPPPERSPNMKASVSRDENCILIIWHLTALASTGIFACPARLLSFLLWFFLPKIKGREGHLPLQIDKYKEITGFDVYSVKTFNDYTMFSNMCQHNIERNCIILSWKQVDQISSIYLSWGVQSQADNCRRSNVTVFSRLNAGPRLNAGLEKNAGSKLLIFN